MLLGYVVVGNINRATSWASRGSKLYVIFPTDSGRVKCLIRSRGGRYIEIWIRTDRIENLRIKKVHSENSKEVHLINNFRMWVHTSQESAENELKFIVSNRDLIYGRLTN